VVGRRPASILLGSREGGYAGTLCRADSLSVRPHWTDAIVEKLEVRETAPTRKCSSPPRLDCGEQSAIHDCRGPRRDSNNPRSGRRGGTVAAFGAPSRDPDEGRDFRRTRGGVLGSPRPLKRTQVARPPASKVPRRETGCESGRIAGFLLGLFEASRLPSHRRIR